MRRKERGGAALVAILIMLIMLAAGTAIMIVTGKGRIAETDSLPSLINNSSADSKTDESGADPGAADSQAQQATESQPEPEPLIPEIKVSDDYRDIDFKKLDISSKYNLLFDADTYTVLAGSYYEKKIYPASLTKVMTILVACENVQDTKAKFKFTEKIVNHLIEENASTAGFVAGESVTFKDLLYSSILVSGGDGTTGLATLVAGSEKKFVELMNKKAEELGLTGTHFTNASGLHDDKHYSTCKDMAIILAHALENKTCKKVLTADTYTTSKTTQHPDGITLYSITSQRLMGYYVDLDGDGAGEGKILGGKTGFTDEAGFALETIYEYDGKTYIAVNCKSLYELNSVEDNIAILENYVLPPKEDKKDKESEKSTEEKEEAEGTDGGEAEAEAKEAEPSTEPAAEAEPELKPAN